MSAILKGAFRAPGQVAGGTGIAQDNIIFAMLLFAFIVWITTKGELPLYLSFFKKGSAQGPPVTAISGSSTTGQTSTAVNPVVGTVVGAGIIPGFPGVNLNNPFAGVPTVGGIFQSILPGNSNGSATQSVPGQANPIPWGSVGGWLKGLF